jgi:isoquinoline 1-oxidoreductase beta subunit
MQSPVFGRSVASFDAAKAKKRPSIVEIFDIPATSTSADAVVAVGQHYWQARAALADVSIKWNDPPNANFDTAEQRKRYEGLLEQGEARVYDRAGCAVQVDGEARAGVADPGVRGKRKWFGAGNSQAALKFDRRG